MAGDTARKLRAVKAVLVLLRRLLIGVDALCEAKPAADERRVVGVSERVVGRSCRLDAHDLHRRTQRLLRARAVGLGIENQLRVIPFIHPRRIHAVEREVFLQNHNVVEAPGQKGAVFAAPVVKRLHCLGKRLSLLLENCVLDAGQTCDLTVHFFIICRADQRLKLVCNRPLAAHADGADLDNFSANRAGQDLFCAVRAWPWLIPFQIQNDVLHTLLLCLMFRTLYLISYHKTYHM